MVQADPLFDVADKVILATGAAGGLGSAVVVALAERGAKVTVTDLDLARAESVIARCPDPSRLQAGALNILDELAVDTTIRGIAREFGRLDGVVNAAGIFRIAPITDMATDDFRQTIECNLVGPFVLTRAAGRAMRGTGGRILHLASVSSAVSNPEYAAYASSKAGLAQLVRVAGRDLASDGITVNAIGQAMTETSLSGKHLADPKFRANAIAHIPMGRLGLPEDILATAILLMAPGGAFITGQTIYVDGGRSLV